MIRVAEIRTNTPDEVACNVDLDPESTEIESKCTGKPKFQKQIRGEVNETLHGWHLKRLEEHGERPTCKNRQRA